MDTRSNGFTLIEVLVVLIIIGVLLSLSVLSIRSDDFQEVRKEAARLVNIMELAKEEAALSNKQIALHIQGNHYEWLARNPDGQWEPYRQDHIFSSRQLPDEITLETDTLDDLFPTSDDSSEMGSLLYFLSSGEITPFEITLHRLGQTQTLSIRITGTPLGELKLVEEA